MCLASTSPARLMLLRQFGHRAAHDRPRRRRRGRHRVGRSRARAARSRPTSTCCCSRGARPPRSPRGSRTTIPDFDGIVIGGDSMFELDGAILGKPHTARGRHRPLAGDARAHRRAALRPRRRPRRARRAPRGGARGGRGIRHLRRRRDGCRDRRLRRDRRAAAGRGRLHDRQPRRRRSSTASRATRRRSSGCRSRRCAGWSRELGVEWTDLWNRDPSSAADDPACRRIPRFRRFLCEPAKERARPVGRLASMPRIAKVLIANRGEIAVRVIRAARDAGKSSVAVYADQDRDALHARLADEAYALDGATSADTYLSIEKILSVARRSGADAVHPGYGFLAENADFARAVIGAGLIWIGPSPEAIEALGDKVTARHVAEKVGAPLAPGTPGPGRRTPTRSSPSPTSTACRSRSRRPTAAAAAASRSPARVDEIPELFESATREAISAFGRGECFVEKYLDKPRHVETQCLADAAGNVVVDLHPRLLAAAPPPEARRRGARAVPHRRAERACCTTSSKAILSEVGYVGAGTCEFLIGADGTDLVPRGQHPPAGRAPGLRRGHRHRPRARAVPHRRGRHARLRRPGARRATRSSSASTARTRAAASCPQPGPIHVFKTFGGPGIRLDSGVTAGDCVSGAFDSLLARSSSPAATAPRRSSARAARSTSSRSPACRPCCPSTARSCATPPSPPRTARFGVFTRWIETEFVNDIPPWDGELDEPAPARGAPHRRRRGRRQAPRGEPARPHRAPRRAPSGAPPPCRRRAASHAPTVVAGASGDAVKSPMQATIVKLAVEDGQQVVKGDLVVVLEAMKMEQPHPGAQGRRDRRDQRRRRHDGVRRPPAADHHPGRAARTGRGASGTEPHASCTARCVDVGRERVERRDRAVASASRRRASRGRHR